MDNDMIEAITAAANALRDQDAEIVRLREVIGIGTNAIRDKLEGDVALDHIYPILQRMRAGRTAEGAEQHEQRGG